MASIDKTISFSLIRYHSFRGVFLFLIAHTLRFVKLWRKIKAAIPIEQRLCGLLLDALSEAFTAELLYEAFRKRKGCVKNALMDNGIVVGIGNIYANETLFICRIDPRRKACEVTLDECRMLRDTAVEVLKCAIECGGTTISDFLNVDGSEGKFVQRLQIYGKAGQDCPLCGGTISSVRLGGRNSFFCSRCQK